MMAQFMPGTLILVVDKMLVPAGRGELNQRQTNWQDAYYNPALRSQGLANDNRTIGTRTTPTWNMSFMDQLAGLFRNSGSGFRF
jgi:hypothetical protein